MGVVWKRGVWVRVRRGPMPGMGMDEGGMRGVGLRSRVIPERGSADDQLRLYDDRRHRRSRGASCQLIDQAAGGSFSHLFPGIVDGRKLRSDDLGDHIIIKAYDGDILR